MSLLEALLAGGLVGGAAVAAVAYLDGARRNVPTRGRLRRALALGGAAIAGFLVPSAASEQLRWLYFEILKPRPVAATPREWLTVNLVTGAAFAGAFVALALVRRRRSARAA